MIPSLRVEPGTPARIAGRDPRFNFGLDKPRARKLLLELDERLDVLQRRLYAECTRSLLLVLQGLLREGRRDPLGLQGLSPQGCRVASFRAPTSTELAHEKRWKFRREDLDVRHGSTSTSSRTRRR
jgi:polyphosphate kinase 2 (PPK2 family)